MTLVAKRIDRRPRIDPRFYIMPEDYGAVGDGVANDTAAIQRAENARTTGQMLRFTPGKTYKVASTYDGTAGEKAKLLRIDKGGTWDLTPVTLLYGSANNITTGTDGGPLGVINVMANGVRFVGLGKLDGATHVQTFIAMNGTPISGTTIEAELVNLLEPGVWTGLGFSVSADIAGGSIASAARNVGGFLVRPACPFVDNTLPLGTIIDHKDVLVYLYGGGLTTGPGSTGSVLVAYTSAVAGPSQLFHCSPVKRGPVAFIANNLTNNELFDLLCFDLGCRAIELYGRFIPVAVALVWGAAVAVNADLATTFTLVATSNIAATIQVPTNPPVAALRNQHMRFMIRNASGGALTTPVAFAGGAGGFKSSGGVSPGNGQQITVDFTYDQAQALWIEASRSAAV